MAYDNPGGDMGGGSAGADLAGDRSHMDDGQEIIHIERDMVPAESLKELKAGDILEFKVVNPDENGLIAVAYNMPKKTEMGAEREGADEMMGDFKEYMSARNGAGEGGGDMSQPAGSY